MSDDFENELLGLAEDEPHHRKKRGSGGRSHGYASDDAEAEVDMDMDDEEDMDMDMDMDIDSDDDDGKPAGGVVNENPYPLEGKYKHEEDRDWLDGLPEIERESILASRQEEMHQYKESLQIAAMYKMTMDQEGDDDDSPRGKRQRKHTSVTTQTSEAMSNLRKARSAKVDRQLRRAQRAQERAATGRRARSSSIASDEPPSSEEGEISRDWREQSPRHAREVKSEREDLDALPSSVVDVNSARLSRYELVEMMFKDGFEEAISGAYVRVMAGGDKDENGDAKYRIQRVSGLDHKSTHGKYTIEYNDRKMTDNRALVCTYGHYERLFRIADVSNGDFTEAEFARWSMTCRQDNLKIPKRSDLKRLHDRMCTLRDRPMTEDEVNREVAARQKTNPAKKQRTVLQISSLYSSMQLALRRKDLDMAEHLAGQIRDLGGDPATGALAEGKAADKYDDLIGRINENNRQRTKVAMQRAHENSIAKRKAEHAIVMAKQAKRAQKAVVEAPPVSGLKHGETPQQYVARTFVLDLGDF